MSSNITNIEDPAVLTWLESLTDRGRRVVLVRDLDGRTSYVSECAPALTGWGVDELAQRLYSFLHPEDQPVLFELSRAMQNGVEAERRLTTRLQHPDGHFQEFSGTVLDRRADPAVRGLVVIMSPTNPCVMDDSPWPALLATSSEILVIHDRDLAIQYVSPNVEKLLGVTPDQLVRDVRSMIHPDDVERFFETRAQVAAERGGEARMRLRVRDAADILHHLDLTIANHLDEHPVDGIIVRARDISDLIETEHLLDRSEARFAAMVASGPGASLLLSGEGEILYCSDGIDELLGYQPEEVVGRFALEFVHPDDQEHAAEELVLLVSGEEDTPTPTFRLRAKDGGYVPVDASATNRLDDPRLGALVLALRDVTDRVTAERRMHRLLQDSSGSAYVINENNEVTWTTPGVERFLGGNRRLTPDMKESLVAEEDIESTSAAYHEVARGGPGTSKRILCRMAPGHSKRWVDVVLTNAFDDPAINGIIVNIRDVDDAVRANETGHRLTEVLESTTDLVCVYDRDFTLIWANAAATAVLGPAPIPGNELERRLTEESMAIGGSEMIPTLRTTGMWRGELCLKRITDGEEIPVEVTALAHRGAHGVEFVSTISRDISERKAMEAQLNAKARHDVLTGLPNRFMLSERLEEMLARNETVGLLFLDLDQFKAVNDTQGHDAGDRLLVAAADRLQGALRPTDLVARFGGDEFIVLLPGVDREDAALRLGERVLAELRGPVQIGSIEVYLTASAGVALSDGADATTLISNADAAMYKAKAGGRDRIAMFSSELRSRTVERLETAHQLRAAVDAGELDVWFQPIIDTVTGIPIALESLARWENGDQGFVSPAHFIEVAEQTGLIGALGTSIVRQTCAAIRALDTAAAPYSFSINLSVHQLADSALPDILRDALETYGIEPRQIHCEITESAVMDDVENSARVLDRIRALGIGIAIDDFGTGYSSLAYLHRLPVDVLKIDREFVSGLSYDMEWQRSLAAGIISLAHSLGIEVVAEGVETAEQAGILRQLRCDAMQGYLFARPTPLDDLPAVLENVISTAPARTW